MTPTKDPLAELATRLAAVGGPDALAVRDGLARHPDQAHLAIRSAVLAASRGGDPSGPDDGVARLVLIVDQFEQVFTLNPDLGGAATRQAFITALCSAATSPAGPRQEPPALVVLAVRGDFWDRSAGVMAHQDRLAGPEVIEYRYQLRLMLPGIGAAVRPVGVAVAEEVEGGGTVRGQFRHQPVVDARVVGETMQEHERRPGAGLVDHVQAAARRPHTVRVDMAGRAKYGHGLLFSAWREPVSAVSPRGGPVAGC
jgi:Novel STAND NTPase 1